MNLPIEIIEIVKDYLPLHYVNTFPPDLDQQRITLAGKMCDGMGILLFRCLYVFDATNVLAPHVCLRGASKVITFVTPAPEDLNKLAYPIFETAHKWRSLNGKRDHNEWKEIEEKVFDFIYKYTLISTKKKP